MKQLLLLAAFLALAGAEETKPNSAVIPKPQSGFEARHREKVKAAQQHQYDLIMIGDSITHNFERSEYKAVWDQFFAPRNALDLGYSGGRTENILWNLQHGEIEGQTPKVVTLLIGTNNSDDANYAIVHTPEQIFQGTEAIVKLLREKLPLTKILLLRIFPRTNVYKNGNTERGNARLRFDTNLRAGELVASLADGKTVFFLDVNHVFLGLNGKIDAKLMPDLLHPSPEGARRWAQAMEPFLCALMGDASHDTQISPNTALIPVPKLEGDFYDWDARHADVLKARATADPEVLLIGDSITHMWGGEPKANVVHGATAWHSTFGNFRALNLGFGWDRIQNVLWRLDHGEMDGLHPKLIVLEIGTNNTSQTAHARANSPEEIGEGIQAIICRLRAKAPQAKLVVMGVFPRGEKPADPLRATILAINHQLEPLGEVEGIRYLDLGPQFLQPDGTLSRQIMGDFVHPTEKGYELWGKALQSELDALKQVH